MCNVAAVVCLHLRLPLNRHPPLLIASQSMELALRRLAVSRKGIEPEWDCAQPTRSRRASLLERPDRRARSRPYSLSRSNGLAYFGSLRSCRRASRYRGKSESFASALRTLGPTGCP